MLRLDREDFEDEEALAELAKAANCTPEEFKAQFGHVVG
jgi:hypothetical protein